MIEYLLTLLGFPMCCFCGFKVVRAVYDAGEHPMHRKCHGRAIVERLRNL